MKAYFNFKPLLIGIISGFLCCFFMLCSATFLVLKSENSSDNILNIVSLIILAISSFFSGFIAGYSAKKKGLIYGSLCGFILFLILFFGKMIVGDNIGYEVILKSFFGSICSVVGAIFGVNKN